MYIEISAYESQELLKAIDQRKATNETAKKVIERMKKQVSEKLKEKLQCFYCGKPKNKRNLNYCTNPECEAYLADKDITWATGAANVLHLNDK